MSEQSKRTAIVTGAARRVGAEIAAALRDDGWTVLAHVRRDSDPVPPGTAKIAADLRDHDCAARIFAAAAEFPPIGLLVNNAAVFSPDSIDAIDAAGLDAHFAVNLRAPALLTAAFVQAARQGLSPESAPGDRLIVNLLDAKLAAPNPDFASYTLSKMALCGLTELAARALAPSGIRVCAIAPALMLRSAGQSEGNFEASHAFNPLGRGVVPGDVVAALRFLLAAPAITGETITIDGGQRYMNLPRDVQYLEIR